MFEPKESIMKKLLLVFIALAMCFSLVYCNASEGEKSNGSDGLEFELSADGNSYTVKGIGKYMGKDLVIPDEYDGKPVTAIAESAFSYCDTIETITVGVNVKDIGYGAFSNCSAVRKIVYNAKEAASVPGETPFYGCGYNFTRGVELIIGKDVEIIPENMFASYLLSRLVIGKLSFEEGSKCKTIGNNAFEGSVQLYDLVLPEGLENIGEEAFKYCSMFIRISLPSTLTNIGFDAFSSAYRVIEIYDLSPLTITSGNLDQGAIAKNSPVIHTSKNAASVVKVQNDFMFTTSGGVNVLLAYLGDEKEISLPQSYEGAAYEIGNHAFEGARIESVSIPGIVKKIGYSAFSVYGTLKYVNFADAVGWSYYNGARDNAIDENELKDSVRAARLLSEDHEHYVWTKGQ